MLYQKYRPSTLDEFVGNAALVETLKSFFQRDKNTLPHALLFSGPSGCGKTTLARGLAKMLGCDGTYGIVEYNAANTRGIDTMRELVSHVSIRPFAGKIKAYILDESHQITDVAQQALLKVIEDNPSYAYFMFCTTEPQNIIATLKNRCTQFEVSSLSRKEIGKLLDDVCLKEQLKIDGEVLSAVARSCNGSPRSALVLLEKISKLSDFNDQLDILYKGTQFDDTIWDLCQILCANPDIRKKKWKEAFRMLKGLEQDPEAIRRAILGHLSKRILELEDVQDASDVGYLLQVFSLRAVFSGKGDLFGMVSRACFGDLDFKD